VVWNIFHFSIFLGKAKNSPRIESEHMEIPEQHYKVVAKLPSAEFQKVCRDLKAAAVFFFSGFVFGCLEDLHLDPVGSKMP